MKEIVFRPKYKGSFWAVFAFLILLTLIMVGLGIMMIAMSKEPHMSDAETIGTVGTILAILSVLIIACILNNIIRKVTIRDGYFMLTSLFGLVTRRPFQPFVCSIKGRFIINGYVFASNSIANQNDLDMIFRQLASDGQLRYLKDDSITLSPSKGLTIFLAIAAIIIGALIGLGSWQYLRDLDLNAIIVLPGLLLVLLLVITINKLPRANKKIWQEILYRLQRPEP